LSRPLARVPIVGNPDRSMQVPRYADGPVGTRRPAHPDEFAQFRLTTILVN
jgi:hypothetical protein